MNEQIQVLKIESLKYFSKKDYPKCLEVLGTMKANENLPVHELWFICAKEAMCHYRMGNYKETVKCCDEVLKLEIDELDYFKTRWLKAIAYHQLKNLELALEEYETSIYLCTQLKDSMPVDVMESLPIEQYLADLLYSKADLLFELKGVRDLPLLEGAMEIYKKLKCTKDYEECETLKQKYIV